MFGLGSELNEDSSATVTFMELASRVQEPGAKSQGCGDIIFTLEACDA